MKKKTTHTKMARKIRVTESELVNMIENIINKNNEATKEVVSESKEDKIIKLTQNDLKNIVEKINKKIEEK